MKKFLSGIAIVMLFISLLTFTSFASDYFVYDAYDLYPIITASSPYSLNENLITDGKTAYVRLDVTRIGNAVDGTEFNVKIANAYKDFYIKDYPVLKIGYRSKAVSTGAKIDLNVGVTYNNKATRLWGSKLKVEYDKSGAESTVIVDIKTRASGAENVSGYSWDNINNNSYVNYLRFKTYWSGQKFLKGEYFDIEYLAFFKTVEDAEKFDYDYNFSKGVTDIYLTEQVRRVVKGDSIDMHTAHLPSFVPSPVGVTYESNNTAVATVDAATGKVTAVSAGTAVITAKYNDMSSTCKVIVLDKEIEAVKLVSRDETAPAANVITSSLGDSITTYAPSPEGGKNYHDWWGQWFYVTNEDRGISGTRLAEGNGADSNAFVNRYDLMRDDANIVTVKGGTNDWGVTSQGKITDRVTSTYRGALRILIEGLIEKYPDRQIVFFTPIKRCENGQTPESVNKYGDTLNDFADAVLEIAAIYDIPAIDLYTPAELDFTSTLISAPYHDEDGKYHDAVCEDDRMPDGLHPSGKGHITIAEYMLKHMKKLGVIDVEGYDIKETIYGDVDENGEVNPTDSVVLSRFLAQWSGYDKVNFNNSDVDIDGEISSIDNVILSRFAAKWTGYEELPYVVEDTSELEYVELGIPGLDYYDNTTDSMSPWDMYLFDNKLFLGMGNYGVNTGPTPFLYYDLETKTWENAGQANDDEINRFMMIDGKLVAPGADSTRTWEYGAYFEYIPASETFEEHWVIPGGIHVFDIAEKDGDMIVSLGVTADEYPAAVSTDGGKTFKQIPFYKNGEIIDFSNVFRKRTYDLFTFNNEVYAVLTREIESASDYYFDLFKYEGSKFVYYADWEIYTGSGYGVTTVTRNWINSEASYDGKMYLAAGKFYSTSDFKNFTKIQIPGTSFVTDLLVKDDVLYVLGFSYNDNGVVDITVNKCTGNDEFTEIIRFEYPLMAVSFEYDGSNFYFGIGLRATIHSKSGMVLSKKYSEASAN